MGEELLYMFSQSLEYSSTVVIMSIPGMFPPYIPPLFHIFWYCIFLPNIGAKWVKYNIFPHT